MIWTRYRAFYEDVIGLETTLVLGAGPGHGRQAVLAAGEVMLHVFEVPGYDPAAHGHGSTMFERGRLDHLGFTVPDEAALATLRDRLVAVDASSGAIRRLGPMLSVRFHDPDEFEGEVNCLDPTYDPSTLRDEDDVVDPLWFARMAAVLHADPSGHRSPTSRERTGHDGDHRKEQMMRPTTNSDRPTTPPRSCRRPTHGGRGHGDGPGSDRRGLQHASGRHPRRRRARRRPPTRRPRHRHRA